MTDQKRPTHGVMTTEDQLMESMRLAINYAIEDQLLEISERLEHIEKMVEQIPRDRGPKVDVRR